jgi:hypothetical protein
LLIAVFLSSRRVLSKYLDNTDFIADFMKGENVSFITVQIYK